MWADVAQTSIEATPRFMHLSGNRRDSTTYLTYLTYLLNTGSVLPTYYLMYLN